MNMMMCFQVDRINPVVTLDVTTDKSPVYSLEYNLQRYIPLFVATVVLIRGS